MTTTTTDRHPTTTSAATDGTVTSLPARRALACCRVLLALVFLWPVIDKSFGLGYTTGPEAAWLSTGASPTAGYLTHLDTPTADAFSAIAGPVTDLLFMIGMLGTGLALLLGIGLRVAAAAGGLLMTSLWLSVWPFTPGSHNPLVDEHLVYTALVVTLALTRAGDTWGLGRAWAGSGIPGAGSWLR